MFMSPEEMENSHKKFIQRIVAQGEVWGLEEEEDAWAYCESNEFEDTDVLVFWSSKEAAAKLATDDWKDYKPVRIPLEAFIEKWLPGMDADGHLVGGDWNEKLCGLEVEPEEVLTEIHAAQGKGGE